MFAAFLNELQKIAVSRGRMRVPQSRKGRRPMHVDTMLKKEKDGSLYKEAVSRKIREKTFERAILKKESSASSSQDQLTQLDERRKELEAQRPSTARILAGPAAGGVLGGSLGYLGARALKAGPFTAPLAAAGGAVVGGLGASALRVMKNSRIAREKASVDARRRHLLKKGTKIASTLVNWNGRALTLDQIAQDCAERIKRAASLGTNAAGYKLQGKTEVQGIPIAIENRKGSVREGKNDDGSEWKTKYKIPYGYIEGTKGADGDEVDAYVGPNKDSDEAFVVHQKKDDGSYDEDTVMLGFKSKADAKKAILQHYDDPKYVGSISPVSMARMRQLVASKKKLVKLSTALGTNSKGYSVGSIPWHFHNKEHGTLKSCTGPRTFKGTPQPEYQITETEGGQHLIDQPQAVGHGRKRKPVMFEFQKKVGDRWLLESGEKIAVARRGHH